jgi:hypothetical protein
MRLGWLGRDGGPFAAGREGGSAAADQSRGGDLLDHLLGADGAGTFERLEPTVGAVVVDRGGVDDADPGAQAVIRTVEAALDTARFSGRDSIVSV